MWAREMYASRLPLGDVQQVLAVVVLAQRLGEAAELVGGDEALAPGDLLQAGDLQALAMLDGLHELRGVDEAVVGAGVEPGIAAAEALHLQLPGLEVAAVEIGNLQLAARRGLQVGSDIADLQIGEHTSELQSLMRTSYAVF